jgi:undecaprenyl-diphosphatase
MGHFSALILGLIEGLTEFLPVSSTAHLLLVQHFLGIEPDKIVPFTILIQLGAILAILLVYFRRLLDVALTLHSSQRSRYFVISILVAFLPAAIIGALVADHIEALLGDNVRTCFALIIGGIILLAVDRLRLKPRYFDAMAYPLPLALKIGLCQCVAMIPGTSRSGATIVGSLLMGTDKRSAAEFSFFLAMPTMVGAFVLTVFKQRHNINFDDMTNIIIGFVAAFVMGLIVVRSLLAFVSRRGYAPFAWWRIFFGLACLIGLYFHPDAPAPATTQAASMQVTETATQ